LIKGKSAIAVTGQFSAQDKETLKRGEGMWARCYAVSTIGFEEGEAQIKPYISYRDNRFMV